MNFKCGKENDKGGLLGKLIGRPANGSARHCCNNTGSDTLEEAHKSCPLVQQPAATHETVDAPHFRIGRGSSGLEHGLDNVHRGGETSGETASNGSSQAVGDRVVLFVGVHGGGNGLVCEKLQSGKRHRHG